MFEGAGEPGIFSVPERRGKHGIFPSPRAYMEGTEVWQLAQSDRNFSQSQSLGGSSVLFQVSGPIRRRQLKEWHLAPHFARCFADRFYSKEKEAWHFSKSKDLNRGGEIGIFSSPRNMARREDNKMELWRIWRNMKETRRIWRKYEENMKELLSLYGSWGLEKFRARPSSMG